MRKLMKTFAVLTATLLAFVSCQQEIDPVASGVSHTLKFLASAPETKTTADIDGTTVTFDWDSDDENRFTVYEINGATYTEAQTVVGGLDADGKMTLMASFDGPTVAGAQYVALFNKGVRESQVDVDEALYDQESDVLVSEVTSENIQEEILTLRFSRKNAFALMTLKGLTEGAKVSEVTVETTNDKLLAAAYDIKEGQFATTGSTKITAVGPSTITDDAAAFFLSTLPVEGAVLKVTAKTVDNDDKPVATYEKTFAEGKSISFTAGNVRPFNVTLEKSGPTPKPLYKKITTVSEIEDGTYVICGALNSDKNKLYYLENTNKTKPSFVTFDGEHISIASDNSTIDVVDATNATWTIEEVDEGFSITSTAGNYALATTTGNDGLTTQSTYVGKPWTIESDDTYNWSFKYNDTDRYLVLYSLTNPRTYTSKSTNASGVFFLYKFDDPRETLATPANLATEDMVLSWDAVEHAGSYEVTVGSADAVTVTTNSYTLEGVADYYSVSVVAVPENTEKYKTSKPATATDLKFGTPTLVTPTLAEGTVTENSITITWAVDKRATAGYDCDIFDGETKLDKSKNVSTGSVSFSGLADGKTYTVKVQAKAITGTKAYAASEVASISVATKAAVHIGDITSAGTYTVLNATVMAVVNTSSFIAGDETGAILVYKSTHGCAVGNIVDIAGSVVTYEGVLEFSTPTISNKRTGSAPVYPTPVEANSDFVNGYSSNAITAYVHGVGTLNNSAKTITIGTKVISLVAVPTPAVADGEVEFTGYVYGVKNGNIKACTLTCQTYVDPTAPTLSINPDPATKTWASDATDKYTVNVTTTNGGWTISPATLTWATVVENHTANTIEITPNGANTTAADYTATITVKHAANPSLTKTITLKQQKAGGSWENATMTAGTNGSSAKVNEKDAIKVGTSKAGGDMKIKVAAGATKVRFYAAAWKDVTGLKLNITPAANVNTTSVALTADTGISNNSPFTLSGTESSYQFEIDLKNITEETTLTLTSSAAKRFVVWGAEYYK